MDDETDAQTSPYFCQLDESVRKRKKLSTNCSMHKNKNAFNATFNRKLNETRKTCKSLDGYLHTTILKMKLDDCIRGNLDILFVGINPGIWSARYSHHYSNPRNHFWQCLNNSGLVMEKKLSYKNDRDCPNFGIGFTNVVDRTTCKSNDLTKTELQEGSAVLMEKIAKYKPKIVCFNGKGIYEAFSGSKCCYGLQLRNIYQHNEMDLDCKIYVMPSTSPRTSSFPRADDKLKFFLELKSIRDHIKSENSI